MACGLHAQFGPAVHWPLWPVVRGHMDRNQRGAFVATVAPHHHDTGWSCHTSASRLHRVERVALVWLHGHIVLIGARWKCGNDTCLANLGPPCEAPRSDPHRNGWGQMRYCAQGCWTNKHGPRPLDLVHTDEPDKLGRFRG